MLPLLSQDRGKDFLCRIRLGKRLFVVQVLDGHQQLHLIGVIEELDQIPFVYAEQMEALLEIDYQLLKFEGAAEHGAHLAQ